MFLLLGFHEGLNAQNSSYASTLYTVEDGLASDIVISVGKDARGYIWVSTFRNIVSSFDAYRFNNYLVSKIGYTGHVSCWGEMTTDSYNNFLISSIYSVIR